MSETPLNEIRIDQARRASGVGDLAFAETKVEEITNNNSLHGQKKSEVSLEESGVSYPSWLKEVMQEAVKESEETKKWPKIPKVSRVLLRNRKHYDPEVVSIGPYHHSDRNGKLSDVEKLKAPMTRQLVKACDKYKLKKLFTEMPRVAKDARSFYDESRIECFNDEEFLKMMFIDGCFILQFIDCIFLYEKLEMTDRQVASVKRDLLLLENQLPFPVLKSLMNVRYRRKHIGMEIIDYFLHLHIFGAGPDDPIYIKPILFPIFLLVYMITFIIEYFDLFDKISRCCHGLRICLPDSDQPPEPQREVEEPSGEDNQPAHLLELLYSKFTGSENGKGIYSKSNPGNTEMSTQVSSGHYLYYSAKNLKRVGIHFKRSWSGALTDVEFKSSIFFGTLKLPRIGIHASTKSLLLNLLSYEESTSPTRSRIASYICFMDSLINDAEDVEELRSKGILVNYLGADKEVADLFNQIGMFLKPDASTYNDVKRKINKQCEIRISKWIAEWQQKYFGSPWTIIAVLAAAFGLALTFAQTYFTRYPPGK